MSKAFWGAVALVAATYVYFLIFAEFAFLELARPITGDGSALRQVMGALGAGGVAGSGWAAWRFAAPSWGRSLALWLAACAGAAGLAVLAPQAGVPGLAGAGAAVGIALGGATVNLASGLRAAVGKRLGLVAGLGTGLAYAGCNVPWVFEAKPVAQTGVAAAAVLAAAGLAWRWKVQGAAAEVVGRKSLFVWVAVFLALVWMDSAAFYIIQHTDTLKAATWQGTWTLWGNATMHLLAAVAAGWALDRGRAGLVVALAAGSLAVACQWLGWAGSEIFYVAGVSGYSAALVFVAGRSGRPWFAAAVFAVSGWVGSALGIGMAQDLHGVPGWFAPVALVVVLGALRYRARAGVWLAVVGVGWAIPNGAEAQDTAILRGRAVYIAEGCIHCHSQYVRPGTEDVVRWGPARPLAEMLAEKPPLPGNRRQGPDLAQVGNRRTVEWNRLHLIAPRVVSPGTRMPSYRGLFAPGDSCGEDLLAYLESLGAGTEEARQKLVAEWVPSASAVAQGSASRGGVEFARLCVQCHGAGARGDGVLASRLAGKPTDLTLSRLVDENALARVIKFGRAGTAMAGHEALSDEAVVSLARYVAGLQRARKTE